MFSTSQPGSGGVVGVEDSAYSPKPEDNREELEDNEYIDGAQPPNVLANKIQKHLSQRGDLKTQENSTRRNI